MKLDSLVIPSVVGVLAIAIAIATPSLEVLALSTSHTFTCTAAADALNWYVNGVGAAHFSTNGIIQHIEEDLGGGLLRLNLTVHAREEHNNSQLQCIAFTGLQGVVVKEVNITIQGLLSSPGNVTTVNGSSSILLSWNAPFTLDITDVDPDISHYTVYITNLNTGRMGEENVTETEFIFTGLPGEGTPDPCHTYQFTVSAWNVVGEGNRSEPEQCMNQCTITPNSSPSASSPDTPVPTPVDVTPRPSSPTDSVPTTAPTNQTSDGTTNIGLVAGPVVAGLLLVAGIVGFAVLCCYLRRGDRWRRLVTYARHCFKGPNQDDGADVGSKRGPAIATASTEEQVAIQLDVVESQPSAFESHEERRRGPDLPSAALHRSKEVAEPPEQQDHNTVTMASDLQVFRPAQGQPAIEQELDQGSQDPQNISAQEHLATEPKHCDEDSQELLTTEPKHSITVQADSTTTVISGLKGLCAPRRDCGPKTHHSSPPSYSPSQTFMVAEDESDVLEDNPNRFVQKEIQPQLASD